MISFFPVTPQGIVINEVMSSNVSICSDEDGNFEDWIEIYNSGTTQVDLGGWFLTDDPLTLSKWELPPVTLVPNSFLLVWASGKDRRNLGGNLHTNFKIKSEGENILLVSLDSVSIIDHFGPVQIATDKSHGRFPDGSEAYYKFWEPTPGTANIYITKTDTLLAPTFSHERGYYNSSFELILNSVDSGAEIYYTIDGSIPTENSRLYEGSISIRDRTEDSNVYSMIRTNNVSAGLDIWYPPSGNIFKGTVVRARCYKEGAEPSIVITHSYFVSNDMFNRYQLPIISLSTDSLNFFDDSMGIYVPGVGYKENIDETGNYFMTGDLWERPVYFELFEKDGIAKIFQNAEQEFMVGPAGSHHKSQSGYMLEASMEKVILIIDFLKQTD